MADGRMIRRMEMCGFRMFRQRGLPTEMDVGFGKTITGGRGSILSRGAGLRSTTETGITGPATDGVGSRGVARTGISGDRPWLGSLDMVAGMVAALELGSGWGMLAGWLWHLMRGIARGTDAAALGVGGTWW